MHTHYGQERLRLHPEFVVARQATIRVYSGGWRFPVYQLIAAPSRRTPPESRSRAWGLDVTNSLLHPPRLASGVSEVVPNGYGELVQSRALDSRGIGARYEGSNGSRHTSSLYLSRLFRANRYARRAAAGSHAFRTLPLKGLSIPSRLAALATDAGLYSRRLLCDWVDRVLPR
jgi:hypothetical protein